MRVGMDLDGTLDKPALAALANALLAGGHEVHIITSYFPEGGSWQSPAAKHSKLQRLGIEFEHTTGPRGRTIFSGPDGVKRAELHILEAVDVSFPLEYRLRDLGLRKGEMCERLGIEVMFDDSATFTEVFRLMNGATTMLRVM